MIFDNKYSLPRPNGATDWLDSPVIAGLMLLTEHPEAHKIKSENYYQFGKYWRYPLDTTLTMSRDNATPLVAALWKQGFSGFVDTKYIDGKDILTPSVRGHFRRCQNLQPSWIQNQWLKFDIMYHAKFEPVTKETNQLLILLLVSGNPYLKMYCEWHKDWKLSILDYWGQWRMERDFAEHMIKFIEAKANG